MKRQYLSTYIALAFLFTGFGSAQDSVAPTIRVSTQIVLLDATVVDAKGRPVEGLTKNDFRVFEDDRPQTILSFEPPREHALPEDSQMPGKILDVNRPEEFGSAPVSIFVLDEMNTHFADSSYGVRSLRSYLERSPARLPQATALFAVNNSHFQLLQGYTTDRDLLLRSLAAHKVMYAWKLENSHSVGDEVIDRLDLSLAALEQIAQNSGSLNLHKNVVWIGAGFPSIDPSPLTPENRDMLQNALQHASDVLLQARVALYAVDPTSTAASVTEVTDPMQVAFMSATEGGSARMSDPFDHGADFDKLAPLSGGRVVRGLNNVDQQIGLSVRLGASFYTLGYRPVDKTLEEHRFRKIKIVCLRPGTTVLSRQGYYSGLPSTTMMARDTVQYDLNNAATASVPLTALQVTNVSKASDTYTLHVTSTKLTWSAAVNGVKEAHTQVMAVALGNRDKVLAHALQSMTAHAKETLHPDTESHDAKFELQFHAPAKATMLRFVVRDAATGKMGTFDLPLKNTKKS